MSDRFDAFRALDEQARGSWIAYATARSIGVSLNSGDGYRANDFLDHLGRLCNIDVAQWWRRDRLPWCASFFILAPLADVPLATSPETPYFPDRRTAMPQSVSSVEASKSFGRISRQALATPITITHHGHDSLVLMSAVEYQRLKSRDREILALHDFTEDDRAAIAASRAPAEATEFDDELGVTARK